MLQRFDSCVALRGHKRRHLHKSVGRYPSEVSDQTGNGVAGWKHLTLYFPRVRMADTYLEIVDWTSEMDRFLRSYSLHERDYPCPQRCTGRSRGHS